MQGFAWSIRYDQLIRSTWFWRILDALQHAETAMPQPAPSFPAFDEWQKLSESEQDALLDRLETAHQSGWLLKQIVVALLLVAACTAIGMVLLAVRP